MSNAMRLTTPRFLALVLAGACLLGPRIALAQVHQNRQALSIDVLPGKGAVPGQTLVMVRARFQTDSVYNSTNMSSQVRLFVNHGTGNVLIGVSDSASLRTPAGPPTGGGGSCRGLNTSGDCDELGVTCNSFESCVGQHPRCVWNINSFTCYCTQDRAFVFSVPASSIGSGDLIMAQVVGTPSSIPEVNQADDAVTRIYRVVPVGGVWTMVFVGILTLASGAALLVSRQPSA